MAENDRQTAFKISIKDIHDSAYVKEEGWMPNYLDLGIKVSRVNLLGVIVSKVKDDNVNYIILDDTTGKISIRSFDDNTCFDMFNVGDLVTIIGRPREYNSEKYIIMELIRKINNPKWMELRKLEWKLISKNVPEKADARVIKSEVITEDVAVENDSAPSEKIYSLIKKLDSGDGVDIDTIITTVNLPNAEALIKNLIAEGEIFEIKTGKVKLLE